MLNASLKGKTGTVSISINSSWHKPGTIEIKGNKDDVLSVKDWLQNRAMDFSGRLLGSSVRATPNDLYAALAILTLPDTVVADHDRAFSPVIHKVDA